MKVGYIVASNEVMLFGKPVGYLYREKPSDENDSGWRVFSGEETQEYADNSDNFSMYNAPSVIEVAPEIREHLKHGFPVAFERDQNSGRFIRIDENDEDS